MSGAMTIAQRDFKSYFAGPYFYIVAIFFTAMLSFTYYAVLTKFGDESLKFMMQAQGRASGLNLHAEVFIQHISNVNLVLLIVTPLLTVKLFSEEMKLRSFDLLLTSPVTATDIVLGKFLAGFGVVCVLIAISMIYPISTRAFSEVQWGALGSAYLGLIFLAAAYVAIGIFCSSLTDSLIVAGISSIILSLMLWFVAWSGVFVEDPMAQAVVQHLSISNHFSQFARGSIELKSIVFHLSLVTLYCFLTQRVVESARWR